ncbi:hypothetical protein [Prevotella fusca]
MNTEEQMNGADEHGRTDRTEQKAQRPKGRGWHRSSRHTGFLFGYKQVHDFYFGKFERKYGNYIKLINFAP